MKTLNMKLPVNNSFRNALLAMSLFIAAALVAPQAMAAADLEINTPAITAIRASMKAHHADLKPHYDSGAVGLTRDGGVAVRDASLVPLAQPAADAVASAPARKATARKPHGS